MKDLHARSPIDKTTALVTGKGFHYEPDKKILTANQDRCERCRHLAYLKRNEAYRRTGKESGINNF